ncbi:hypothetical protein FRC02_003575 [Tulasnella sp. 418]|nr:hypothetical protein FRC02_003575 [Tulasnella sp. 418]
MWFWVVSRLLTHQASILEYIPLSKRLTILRTIIIELMSAPTDITHLDLTNQVEFGEHGRYSDIYQGTYSKDDEEKDQVAIKALRVQGPNDTTGSKERLLKICINTF